jgi:hypothetical protein
VKSRLLGIYLIILTSVQAFACASANQKKIYPIGLADQGLVALHVELHRGDGPGPGFSISWNCTSTLKIYSKNNEEISSTTIDSNERFGADTLLAKLTHYYADAFDIASKISNIQLLKPEEITYCDFGVNCSLGKYSVDSNKQKIEIEYQSTAIDITRLVFKTIKISYSDSKIDAAQNLELSTVRLFTVGDKKLLIYHLGTGNKGSPADGSKVIARERSADFDFTSLKNSVYVEPILHHGTGFDVFVWL